MPRTISTLTGIARFQSGVGDNEDLLTKVRESADGGWYPVLRPGHFYVGTEEGYLYADAKLTSLAVTGAYGVTGSQVFNDALVFDPTERGPLRMRRESTGRYYQRVCSSLRAFLPLPFTQIAGELYRASCSGILVQVLTHPVTGIMRPAPSTGDILSHEEFYHEPETGYVYIRNSTPPRIYINYLVGFEDSDKLNIQDVLVVGSDSLLRTQYSGVMSGATYGPVIRKPTPNGTISVTGSVISGNIISYSNSNIATGDVVAVDYYVGDSFALFSSGSTSIDRALTLTYLSTASGTHTIFYEDGEEHWYDTSLLPLYHINKIQLNPLLEPQKSGFLYLVDDDEPWPNPVRIEVHLSNHNPLINRELVNTIVPTNADVNWWSRLHHTVITAVALDAEDNPVPDVNLTATVAGVDSHTFLYRSNNKLTNNIGECSFGCVPYTSGNATVIVVASDYAISGTITFRCWDVRTFQSSGEMILGKLFLHMEQTPYIDGRKQLQEGWYKVNAYYCYNDGSPFQPMLYEGNLGDAYLTPWVSSIYFSTDNSPMRLLNGRTYTSDSGVKIGPTSIASILVQPKPGDTISAYIETPELGANNQPRRRYARPVKLAQDTTKRDL